MTESIDIKNWQICLTGTFDVGLKTIERRIRLQGATQISDPDASMIVCGRDPDPAVLAAGKKIGVDITPIEKFAPLGPLYRFVERLDLALAETPRRFMKYRWNGAPASDEELAAAEARLGFALDPAVRSLYAQANGVTIGIRGLQEPDLAGPHRMDLFMSPAPRSSLWEQTSDPRYTATMNLAPLKDLFVRSEGEKCWLPDGSAAVACAPGETIEIGEMGGRTTYDKRAFYQDLVLFDATYGYAAAYLHVDRARQQVRVVIGSDHGVDFTNYAPTSVEDYLESALSAFPVLTSRTLGTRTVQTWWGA